MISENIQTLRKRSKLSKEEHIPLQPKRKHYLDNIRWFVIVLVVIFHIFFYYNNIGIPAMFDGLEEYNGSISLSGLFQYIVYPWFMLLLFIVSGISARIALMRRTDKEFMRSRVDKILVPSTLGVLAFGWIGGYVIYLHNVSAAMPDGAPGFVGVIISILSGTGALWFCHVLFVAVLVLMLIRIIIRKCNGDDDKICNWINEKMSSQMWSVCILLVIFMVFWGGAHVLNMPLITSYRNGIYIPGFLIGYYIFSNDNIINQLKKYWIVPAIGSFASGAYYIYRCYGMAYSDIALLARLDVNVYVFFMILTALGFAARFCDKNDKMTDYMNNRCFGIYVLHIPVLLVTDYILVGSHLPMTAIYSIELVTAFAGSIVLYEIIRRIPVLRYWILGIKRRLL